MITLKEIAELAGVSRGTVDRALKNRSGVSKAVAERINAIVSHYGYTPNKLAQALVNRKKEFKIGVISSSVENPFFKNVTEGIRCAEKEVRGLGVSLCYREVPKFDPDTQLRVIDEVLAEDIDGLAIRPVNDEAVRLKLFEVRRRGIPLITFNTDLEGIDELTHIGSDFRKMGRLAAGILAGFSGGEGRVVIPIGSLKSYGPKIMADEFCEELQRYPGMSVAAMIETVNDDILTYTRLTEYIRSDPGVSAFFFASGGKEGGIRAIREADLPDKVDIVTVNLDPFTRECLEKGVVAATICHKPFVQGYEPVTQLANYIVYGDAPEQKIQYTQPEIIIRQSL
jgi:LacI family transcriptional regulator